MDAFSFDLIGELALFKKNDANDMVHVSYNFIHRPVVLGMLGAIMGYPGYAKSGTGKIPEYYKKLKHLKIGIQPHYKKPLRKVITGFNNASGMGSKDGTWQINEQILVGESEIRFTIFILNDNKICDEIKTKLSKGESEYPLYFGKNEFFAHYDDVTHYNAADITNGTHKISSLVRKGEDDSVVAFSETDFSDYDPMDVSNAGNTTVYEHLPYDFDEMGFYKKDLFIWTGNQLQIKNTENFFSLKDKEGKDRNVQFV